MIKNYKIIVFLLFISFFLSLLVEKFIYNMESFNFLRFLIVFFSFYIFIIVLFFVVPNIYQQRILVFSSLIYDFIYKYLYIFFNSRYILLIKYLFSFIITLYLSFIIKDFYYFIFGTCELLIILLLSNYIFYKISLFGYVINSFLLLLYNINIFVIIFGGSFLNMIMLTNVNSISALRGKAIIYIAAVLFTLFFSFLPIIKLEIKRNVIFNCLIGLLFYEILLLFIYGFSYSVFSNYGILTCDGLKYYKTQSYIKHTKYNKRKFYKKGVSDNIKYNHFAGDKPNIIVIFTEGLSDNIIYDKRKIMPNLKKISKKSISFKNYYNHTAATYRGLIGQLYSGYQLNNTDKNNLVSIEKILSRNGYETVFINNEPGNEEFSEYLGTLQFNNIVSSDNAVDGYVSDKEAYNYLYDEAIRLNDNDKPFFIGIYTFFTHVSFDSDDEKFGNGKDNLLNRFYNLDYQFGEFINKFEKSSLYDNTIIFFTTDHASYVDSDYLRVFGKTYKRDSDFYDKIPLMIYHKDVKSKKIDVKGRNSLDLAPTILDYIDISGKNYFLGTSLFSSDGTKFDKVYYDTFSFLFDNIEKKKDIKYSKEAIENDINGYLSVCSK